MKTIIATTIALLTATSVSATILGTGTAEWNGTSGTVHGSADCEFKKNDAGTMTYDSATGLWTVTNPAIVVLKSKNANNMKVVAGTELLDSNGNAVADVAVDYRTGSSVSIQGKSDGTSNINIAEITAGNLKRGNNKRTKVKFTIDGTAQMGVDSEGLVDDLEIDNNTNYTIEHTVTCIQ